MTGTDTGGTTIVCPNGCDAGERQTTEAYPTLTACPGCGSMRQYQSGGANPGGDVDASD